MPATWARDGLLRVTHPEVDGAVVMAPLHWEVGDPPASGRRTTARFGTDWPGAVAAEDGPDRISPFTWGAHYFWALVALPPAAALRRRRWLHRINRLAGRPDPPFAVLGQVVVRRGEPLLALWSLDARPGDRSLALVPLLSGDDLAGQPPAPMEVRGRLGPTGRIVARRGTTLLVPTGRGLLDTAEPLPHTPPATVSPGAVPFPPVAGPAPPPSRWGSRSAPLTRAEAVGEAVRVGAPFVGAVASVLLAVSVAGVAIATSLDDRPLEEGRHIVRAEVVAHPDDLDVDVRLPEGDGQPARRATFTPEAVEAFPVGAPVLVLVDGSRVEGLAPLPYDLIPPLLLSASALSAAAACASQLVRRRHRSGWAALGP